jgi:hypothetical protein
VHFKVVVGICFCNNSIIVQVGYINIATKEVARIRHNTFLVVHLGPHLSSQAEGIQYRTDVNQGSGDNKGWIIPHLEEGICV